MKIRYNNEIEKMEESIFCFNINSFMLLKLLYKYESFFIKFFKFFIKLIL